MVLHFYLCAVFPRYARKNRRQRIVEYHAAAVKTRRSVMQEPQLRKS